MSVAYTERIPDESGKLPSVRLRPPALQSVSLMAECSSHSETRFRSRLTEIV